MSAVVDVVEAVLARFTAAAAHIDAQMWPDEPPRGVMYLKIWPDGRREWLMLSTERWETIRADPVGLDEEYGQRLDAWVEEMERANPGRTKPCLTDPFRSSNWAVTGRSTTNPGCHQLAVPSRPFSPVVGPPTRPWARAFRPLPAGRTRRSALAQRRLDHFSTIRSCRARAATRGCRPPTPPK